MAGKYGARGKEKDIKVAENYGSSSPGGNSGGDRELLGWRTWVRDETHKSR